MALSMADAGLAPKLRSFTPALAGFAERGDVSAGSKVCLLLLAGFDHLHRGFMLHGGACCLRLLPYILSLLAFCPRI